jgi:methylmalonyl-CoA mutase
MMTKRDPHVNILRTTIAAFGAGVGGADAIAVLPFTAALGLPDRFARRIARNSQLLLLEESNVARVADPAAGSGGIEDLTDKLCRAAWTLFQEIEAAGGAPIALEQGLIQDKIAKVRAEHQAAIAHRKDALTGTSDFPNLGEAGAPVLDPRPVAFAPPVANFTYPALRPLRLAEPFERLRDASDAIFAKAGTRPKIFLANLGTPAEFTARAIFAKTFFEAGGIEALGNDGFVRPAASPSPSPREAVGRGEPATPPATNIHSLIAAFKASSAKLACLCSSDAVYEREAAFAAKALKAAGATHIYLAGRPKDAEPLKAAGVETFVFAGCDALATLNTVHDILGK